MSFDLKLHAYRLLMDEPFSSLDVLTAEALRADLLALWEANKMSTRSILIVTHNMAQARRASDECIFMLMGKLMEHSDTTKMFVSPESDKTAAYIEGRYG